MALESPYYGSRRPPWQEGSKLARVSDLLTLGRTTIEESLYLLAWAQQQNFQRLGESWGSMFLRLSCHADLVWKAMHRAQRTLCRG